MLTVLLLCLAAPPELGDAGKKPHVALRYAPAAAANAQRFVATTELKTTQTVAGSPAVTVQPRLEIGGLAKVTRADERGFAFELRIETVDAKKTKGADAGSARTAQKLWSTVLPIRVTFEIDARGRQERAQLKLPEGVAMPEPLRDPLQTVYELVRGMHAPLPAEPVGVGGTWTVSTDRVEAGVRTRRKTTWRLASRRGDRVELTFEATEKAEPQAFDAGDLPEGMTARLEAVEGTATGRLVVDLGRPVPTRLEHTHTITMKIEGRAGLKPFTIRTDATTKVTLEAQNATRRRKRR